MDGAAYFSLLRSVFPEIRFYQGVEVVFLGVFANVATFSAGTIPMQSYYLHCCGMVLGTGVGLAILEYVLGREEISFWHVQALSAMMMLLAGAIPNVAGMGPAEFAFLLVFSPYIGHIAASSALILYRLSTYFLPFFISIIVFCKTKFAGQLM